MSMNLFYDHDSGRVLNVLFSNDYISKSYDHYFTSYEELVEVYMDLRKGRGFSALPENYEFAWEIKPKEDCLKIYRNIEEKLKTKFKKLG